MNILITNDDGISSLNLRKLATWAQKHGNVTVVAPKHEQSGKSQAIDFRSEVEAKRVDNFAGCETWSLDSTPADCVRFGFRWLQRNFDLVLSGINCGYNLGSDIAYSGTVGAILEAARLGVNAIALSTDRNAENSDILLDDIYRFVCENSLFEYAHLLNVNIPASNPFGIKVTRQGGIYFTDRYISREGNMYIQIGEPITDTEADDRSDIVAVRNGYISVTPITEIRTDLVAFDKIKDYAIKFDVKPNV